LTFGEIPKDMCICHSCDEPGCCNPFHCFLGTNQDNSNDAKNKGRMKNKVNWTPEKRVKHSKDVRHGPSHWNNKLTDEQIKEIRQKYKPRVYTLSKLAKEYNVRPDTIHKIVTFKSHKNVGT